MINIALFCNFQVFLQLYLQIKLKQQAVVHFIETAPSVLRDVPWLKVREYKVYTVTNYASVPYICTNCYG